MDLESKKKEKIEMKIWEKTEEVNIPEFDEKRKIFEDELKEEKVELSERCFYDINIIIDILIGKREHLKRKYLQYKEFEVGFFEPWKSGYNDMGYSAEIYFLGVREETNEEYEKRKKECKENLEKEKIRKQKENEKNIERKMKIFKEMAKELGYKINENWK